MHQAHGSVGHFILLGCGFSWENTHHNQGVGTSGDRVYHVGSEMERGDGHCWCDNAAGMISQ